MAKDTKTEPQAATMPEPTAAPVAQSAPVAETVKRFVRFAKSKLTEDDIKAKHAAKKNATVANATVRGLFSGALAAICVTDFGVTVSQNRDVVVYMPSAGMGFYKHLAPAKIMPEPLPADVLAVMAKHGIAAPSVTEPTDDPAGKRACEALATAIRQSWIDANVACKLDGSSPYDRDWPLSI